MKRPLVVANWKMNGSVASATALLDALVVAAGSMKSPPEVAVAPPFTLLQLARDRLAGSEVRLAAQNLHPATHGAFTGEISGPMLGDLGARYVIVGHSERRRLFGESDDVVGRKAAAAEKADLVPILCVGEEESDRIEGRTFEVIGRQLRAGAAGLRRIDGEHLVVAYEPVWAIGTGRTASPGQASEAHAALAEILTGIAGADPAREIRILYGGSVTPETMPGFATAPGVDGALVGGASLGADSFVSILQAVAVRERS